MPLFFEFHNLQRHSHQSRPLQSLFAPLYRKRRAMRWTLKNRAKVEALGLGCKDHRPDEPRGYVDRLEWTKRMYRTHLQVRCPECDLYKCWVPRSMFSGAP